MSDPYLGEIKIVSFNFPPKGWAFCNGQLLPINQNQALFSLLGTMYGGNGQTNFGLPNFQGRTANHVGSGFSQGQVSGEDNHTLTLSELPTHPHVGQVQPTNATTGVPTNSEVLAAVPSFAYRTSVTNTTTLEPTMISKVGGSQPHSNQQPYLVLNFVIALQGVFPSRN